MPIIRSTTLRSAGAVYRPRWMALLTVPIAGTRRERERLDRSNDVVTIQTFPKSVRIERNDHNQADLCSIVLDWRTAGVDARILDDATVEVHVADADETGFWVPSTATCRFIGIVKEVNSTRSDDSPAEVLLNLVDFTELFLKAKPFGSLGVPRFSQRLSEAWQTIVGTSVVDGEEKEHTPGTGIFRDNPGLLIFQGVDPDIVIGKGVSERFRQIGKVQTKPDTDAWAVWQQCVGMLGLISYIDKDKCVVTTATNYYTESDAPVAMWGRNILTWQESRVSALARRGVCMTSFDPLNLRTLEAYYPPIGDEKVRRKRTKAKKVLTEAQLRPSEERDYFSFPGVTEYEALLDIAKRVWEERSRQELEGSISTPHMVMETEQNGLFDLLDLRAGDSIRVETEPEMQQLLSALDNDAARLAFLEERGYSEDAAQLIIANMKNFADLDAKFLVKRVGIEMEVNENGGSFSVDIDYINRIQIDGSA